MRLIVGDDENTSQQCASLGKPCSHPALGTPELVVLYRWNFCIVGGARPPSLGGGRARLSADAGALMGGRESSPRGVAGAERVSRMHA